MTGGPDKSKGTGEKEMTPSVRYAMLTVILVVVAALLAACGGAQGGSGSATRTVAVGEGKEVQVNPDEQLKIALFVEISNNSAVQSTIEGAEKKAKELRVEIDVFDANLDSAKQVNQLQNALLRDYNAWVVVPVEGQLICDVVTNQAPQKGILVATPTGAVCGRSSNEGKELWSPGTLTYVGGNEAPSAFKATMEQAVKDNPGPQKVGVITGPDLHPITVSMDKAIAEVTKEHPEFDVVSKLRTDYSPPDSQKKFETMLQANPDLDTVVGAYTNMSKGVVPVLQSRGLVGEVKVYENGGTEWSVDALKKDWIESTTTFYRRTAAEAAIQAIADARKGKEVPHVILNDGHEPLPGQQKSEVGIVTRENVDEYQPESP